MLILVSLQKLRCLLLYQLSNKDFHLLWQLDLNSKEAITMRAQIP
jgi:hypothetical protein